MMPRIRAYIIKRYICTKAGMARLRTILCIDLIYHNRGYCITVGRPEWSYD
jgi:hypothetical protein